MKQIYDFEQYNPPILNENMLKNEIERRQLHKQTIILAIAGVLAQIAVLMFGFMIGESYPMIAIVCFGYVLVSIMGSSTIAVIYARKGGITV